MAESRPRDAQRSRVYAAEDSCTTIGRTPMPLPAIAAFLRQLQRSPWFRRTFPGTRPMRLAIDQPLRSRAEASGSFTGGHVLRFAPTQRVKLILLHEVAHCVVPDSEPSHGRTFVRAYLVLVRHYLGVAAWRTLRAAFDARGVRYRRTRPRPDLRGRAPGAPATAISVRREE